MSSLADDTNWAVTEFADAELGDVRRTKRLVELAGVLAQHPTAALPEACGDGAMLKAAYRFFANDAIAPQDLLHSHIEATYSRLATSPWCWRCKIPPKSTGRPPGHPGLGALGPPRPVRGCLSIARWRSRPSGCPWGCWPNRSGRVTPTTWASAPGASSCPSARRKARNGSRVWRPCAARTTGVPRPALSALATGKPMSTTCWRPSVRRASSC